MHTKYYDLCNDCLGDLSFIQDACPRCALPMMTDNALCGTCLNSPPPFHYSHSLLEFNWQSQFLIHHLKYKKNPAFAKLLATLFIQHLNIDIFPDALLAVPLHNKRLKQRGFNQSQLITNQLAKHYRLPIINQVARIKKHNPKQALTRINGKII
ncbi:ComF family protein [Piscirickettsia litoralis]|uniref:ComF family protein n=1 Tax=Piscirickettsia litoralis TaxID=1891921 RepID=UPI000B0DED49|nr:hypothetical protein [Piscirickettsia litoralis]